MSDDNYMLSDRWVCPCPNPACKAHGQAEIKRLRDALEQIAAQDSGDPKSTSRSDAMARLASLALRTNESQS